MARLADLLYFKISRFVKLVFSQNNLAIENDHNLIFGRNDNQLVFKPLHNCNLFDKLLESLLRNALKEWEHVKISA